MKTLIILTTIVITVIGFAAAGSNDLVTIDGNPYSILKRPSTKSEMVKTAREEVAMTLDFQDMSHDLILISKFFQLAENGLVEYPTLQGKVKSSEITILLLTDESEVAFADFVRVSGRVLDNLEATYRFLNKGFVEMAINVYTRVANDAEKMAKKAEDLYSKYKSELTKLEKILQETFDTKELEEQKKRLADSENRERKANLERLYVQKEEAHKKYIEMHNLFLEAKRQERKALKKSDNFFKTIVNAVTTVKYGVSVFDMGSHKDAAKAHRAAKEKFLEEREKVRDAKTKIMSEIAEFAQRIKNSNDVKELAEIAVDALQKVIGRLQGVVTILANTVKFWNLMSGHLNGLKDGDFLREVLKIDKKELQDEILSDDDFKYFAIQNYARWVATHEAMIIFRQNIKPAREKMANIVLESLNKEEAMKKIKEVGQEISAEEWRAEIGMDVKHDEF